MRRAGHARNQRKGGITIDILVLVDRMEELFRHGSHIPMSRRVIVDEQAFLDVIDQMRIAIPEEIRLAKRISDERVHLLSQAHQEANQVRAEAEREAQVLLARDTRLQAADTRANQLLAEARLHAEQLKAEADTHCIAVLSALEQEVSTILTTTRNGIQHMQVTTTALKGAESQASEKGH